MMKLLKVMMKEQDRSSGNGRRREADKGGGGCFKGIRFKTCDKNINRDDARREELREGEMQPPGKVLTSGRGSEAENNEKV